MKRKIIDLFSKKKLKNVFIIAEIGSNHNQNYNQAIKLINIAKKHGVDAVKFQSFKTKALYSEYVPNKINAKGKKIDIYKMFKKIEMPYEWHSKLIKYCNKIGIIFISSPFDEEALGSLENNNCPIYKIASSEIGDLLLIKKIAKTKKPIILSTGKSNLNEIKRAIKWIENEGNKKIILLHCTASYPAKYESMNLNNIVTMKKNFNYKIGLSDHNMENITAVTAVALGAEVIEKHITINNKDKGPDHHFALEPYKLKELVQFIRNTEKSLGSFEKKIDKSETKSKKIANRSLHAAKNLKKGQIISERDLIIKRPNLGIEPRFYKKIIGKKIKRNIIEDKWITWNDVEI